MTTEEGFLRAILANINDTTYRLVFADWLEDHGDPRAEWLRVNCELAELGAKDGRRPALEARKRELWDAHRDGLVGWERRFALARIQSKVARIPVEAAPHEPALLRQLGKPHIESPLQPNSVLSEAELLAFEAEYRVTLPDEYRLFLREVGNGGLGPGDGLLRLADGVNRSPSRDLGTPFPYSIRQYREDPDRFYEERSAEEYQPWPGVLFVSEPDSYGYAYLVITGEDRGRIWGFGPHNCGWTPECPSSVLDNKWAHGELRSFFRWYEDWLDDWLDYYLPKPAGGGGG